MADVTTTVAAPWSAPTDVAKAAPRRFDWKRLLPVVGPLILFVAWDLVVRLGFIKPILLPTPMATLGALFSGLAGGPLLTDFAVTPRERAGRGHFASSRLMRRGTSFESIIQGSERPIK